MIIMNATSLIHVLLAMGNRKKGTSMLGKIGILMSKEIKATKIVVIWVSCRALAKKECQVHNGEEQRSGCAMENLGVVYGCCN